MEDSKTTFKLFQQKIAKSGFNVTTEFIYLNFPNNKT